MRNRFVGVLAVVPALLGGIVMLPTHVVAEPKVAEFKTHGDSGPIERGYASWYGSLHHGRRTASGEKFDKNALTAAHKRLPFNTRVRVTYLRTMRSVDVRINDRGPFASNRIIDLSEAAAKAVGLEGVGEVSVVKY
jgi:rare lipoprotein A